jgi:hypothetical protein
MTRKTGLGAASGNYGRRILQVARRATLSLARPYADAMDRASFTAAFGAPSSLGRFKSLAGGGLGMLGLASLKSLARGMLGTISLPPFGGNEMVGGDGIEPPTLSV